MTGRDKLFENYEDALFALLMDEVANEEGDRLLEENKRMKQDPEAEIPDAVNQRCMNTIRQAFEKEQRREAGRAAYQIFRHAAVVAVVAILLFTTAFAAFPEVRVRTLNFLIEVSDVSTVLRITGDESGSNESADNATANCAGLLRGYRVPAVPDGFTVNGESESSKTSWIQYCNEEGAGIRFEVFDAGGNLQVDTEDAENVESIIIHGYEGMLIEKGGWVDIVWGDTDQANFIIVSCNGLDKELAWSLAEEMVFQGSE